MTQPITVEDAAALAGLTYTWEVESAPDASPMAGPARLRANDGIDPRIPPCRYLLARPSQGQLAALPMHAVHSPTTPYADPRSYFGGTAEITAGQVCCGSQQSFPAAQTLARLGTADVFPALVLGSLPGYKTEILHSYWTPELAADLVDAAIRLRPHTQHRDHRRAVMRSRPSIPPMYRPSPGEPRGRTRCHLVPGNPFGHAECHLSPPDPSDIRVTNDLRGLTDFLSACVLPRPTWSIGAVP